MDERQKQEYRIDVMKLKRKIYDFYPPGSSARKKLVRDEMLREIQSHIKNGASTLQTQFEKKNMRRKLESYCLLTFLFVVLIGFIVGTLQHIHDKSLVVLGLLFVFPAAFLAAKAFSTAVATGIKLLKMSRLEKEYKKRLEDMESGIRGL